MGSAEDTRPHHVKLELPVIERIAEIEPEIGRGIAQNRTVRGSDLVVPVEIRIFGMTRYAAIDTDIVVVRHLDDPGLDIAIDGPEALADEQVVGNVIILASIPVQVLSVEMDQFVTVEPERESAAPLEIRRPDIHGSDRGFDSDVVHLAHRRFDRFEAGHHRDRTGKDLVPGLGIIRIHVPVDATLEPGGLETGVIGRRGFPSQVGIAHRTDDDAIADIGTVELITDSSALAADHL